MVGLGPGQLQDVGEEALGDAVAAHDALGELVTLVGEGDLLPADAHEALGFHALDHL